MFKIRLNKKPTKGSQQQYGLITGSTYVPTVSEMDKPKQTMQALSKEDIKNGAKPTIEVEGGEEVIGDVNRDGNLEKFRFTGRSHAEGGMDVDIPDGSFIYSKKLKLKDTAQQEEFGLKPKKAGYSFSDIAKKYDINSYVQTLKDPSSDAFAKNTAQKMLDKNTLILAKLALSQEASKGMPNGVPKIAQSVLGLNDVQSTEFSNEPMAKGGELNLPFLPIYGEGGDPLNGLNQDELNYFKQNHYPVVRSYEAALKSKDPQEIQKHVQFLKQYGDSHDLPGLGISPWSLQDKLQDITGIAEQRAEDLNWSKGSERVKNMRQDNLTELEQYRQHVDQRHKDAWDYYNSLKKDPDVSMSKLTHALDHAKRISAAKDKIKNENFEGKPVLFKTTKEYQYMKPYIDRQENIKQGVNTGKAIKGSSFNNDHMAKFDYKYNPETKQWLYRTLNVDPSLYTGSEDEWKTVTNATSLNTLNKYKPSTQNVTKQQVQQNTQTQKVRVANVQQPKVTQQPQTVPQVEANPQEVNSETLFDLDKYEGGKEVNTKNPLIKTQEVTSKSGKKLHVYFYQNGTQELVDPETKKVLETKQGKPLSTGKNKFAQYHNPELQQIIMDKVPNAVFTNVDYGTFNNQPRDKKTGTFIALDKAKQEDFLKRHGNLVSKYPGGKEQFIQDINKGGKTGDAAAGWFQDNINQLSQKILGEDYFKPNTTKDPYSRDGKFARVTYSVPNFYDIPGQEPAKDDALTPEVKTPPPTPNVDHIQGDQTFDQMPDKTKGWWLPDYVNFATAALQQTNDFRPVKGRVDLVTPGYALTDPTTAIAGLQSNQAKVQNQIENTTAGPVGTAASIGASATNAQNVADAIANSEAQNVGIVNQSMANNAQIQNQQAMTNANLLQKFVQESADFGNNKTYERNLKRAQMASLYNTGTDNMFKRKMMENVLFPQVATNPLTGDVYVGGKGKDLLGPDVSASTKSTTSGDMAAAYTNAYKKAKNSGLSDEAAREQAKISITKGNVQDGIDAEDFSKVYSNLFNFGK